MLDEKDLQAIAELLDKKLKEEIGASESRMAAYMEAYFDPKFNSLADQFKLIQEKVVTHETLDEAEDQLNDRIDDLEERVDDLDVTVKRHTREIAQLKKAQ